MTTDITIGRIKSLLEKVERALDEFATQFDQSPKLCRSARDLDLEIADERQIARDADQKLR